MNGDSGPGLPKLSARQELLTRLLRLQNENRLALINDEERFTAILEYRTGPTMETASPVSSARSEDYP
ncbi:MAG: hypothetical protein MZV70_59845 [Desulfobacterales bacterium]|nr:hypothetical protein [Desulfobacterales bacterium]